MGAAKVRRERITSRPNGPGLRYFYKGTRPGYLCAVTILLTLVSPTGLRPGVYMYSADGATVPWLVHGGSWRVLADNQFVTMKNVRQIGKTRKDATSLCFLNR